MADQTNPFTMAGMAAMMQPNKYTDPAFRDKPLGLQGYVGTPTDALGNPIKSFTDAQAQHDAWDAANPAPASTGGLTLNSNPGAVNAGVLTGLNYRGADGSLQTYGGAGAQPGSWVQTSPGGIGGGNAHNYDQMAGQRIEPTYQYMPAQQQQAAPAAAAPTNPIDMRQAYLTALSNPGKVTTPGANVPQAQPLGEPSVLNAFLAAHPGGGTAAPAGGGYGNAGFFSTLDKLRAQA
jgi:hypothetical protein